MIPPVEYESVPSRAPRSAAFKRWFGASKIVDAKGRPLVVYHGTPRRFEAFEDRHIGRNDEGAGGRGFYFMGGTEYPTGYAQFFDGESATPTVLAVYLKMENPLVVDDYSEIPGWTIATLGDREAARRVQQGVRVLGYDGIIQYHPNPHYTEYVVFEPTQIKSVNNVGTWSPTDPRMRHNPRRPVLRTNVESPPRDGVLPPAVEETVHLIQEKCGLAVGWYVNSRSIALHFYQESYYVGFFRASATGAEEASPFCREQAGGRPLWVVRAAEWYDERLRRQGLGFLAYTALFRYVIAQGGVMGPEECTKFGSTDVSAYGVWRKLKAQGWPVVLPEGRPNGARRQAPTTDYDRLQPDDILRVYHGTSLTYLPSLINGFDATAEHHRHYGGPRHAGLFVAPTEENASQFGPEVVLEIEVQARFLHGTDYSGNIGRASDAHPERMSKAWVAAKYPASFRPLLSESLQQQGEPQALLKGLVSPGMIKRVRYKGKWYSRAGFLSLGLTTSTPENPYAQHALADAGFDLSNPGYPLPVLFEHIARLLDATPERITDAFFLRARVRGEPAVRELLDNLFIRGQAQDVYTRKIMERAP